MLINDKYDLTNLLLSVSYVIDLVHPEIFLHQLRTAYISLELCIIAGFKNEIIQDVYIAALFHDAGALTIHERIEVHKNFNSHLIDLHCIRGEILLKRVPFFNNISRIVRCHHKNWNTWGDESHEQYALCSQIVYLADYIESYTLHNRFILHQRKEITESVNAESGKMFNPFLIKIFNSIANREDFWLDIISPDLYYTLLKISPLNNIKFEMADIEKISKFFRDIIDYKSPYTATHTSGVSACAEMMGRLFNLTEFESLKIKIAGNLHDIGKLLIPNTILEKPGKLTDKEFEFIKCHAYYTYEILKSTSGFKDVAEWAGFHHEKPDGGGYPFHYGEQQLTTGSRIMRVSDIFTAMLEERPYRPGLSFEEIYDEFRTMISAKSVDKKIVELLFDNYKTIEEYVAIVQHAAFNFYETRLIGLR